METYVIRIGKTQHTDETRQDELRGVVEHVGTGHRRPFMSARELLAFLHTDHRDPREEFER
jgi:hypothetical protein